MESLPKNYRLLISAIIFRSEGTEQRFFGKKLIIHPNIQTMMKKKSKMILQ